MDKIISYAKINLFLEVTGRRSDGYHDIDTVMQRISLCDTMEAELTDGGIFLYCDAPDIPLGEENLVCKAAKKFFDVTGISAGITLKLEKHIPSGAGLGGGSSDAASVFCYLCEKFGQPLSEKDKLAALKSLGADVPFFARNGCGRALGIGEELKYIPAVSGVPALIIPGRDKVSTALAYGEIDSVNAPHVDNKLWDVLKKSKDLSAIAPLCFNRFEDVSPYCRPVIEALSAQGASVAHLSGSGSSVYSLFDSFEKRDAAAKTLGGISCETI